ncbi:MAG TPA: hypothetical protein PKA74_18825 [Bauldia sp.]|nr:hypothetical protein [Bauldia sp.]
MAAIERISLSIAVERGDPMLAEPAIRREATELVKVFLGHPAPLHEIEATSGPHTP